MYVCICSGVTEKQIEHAVVNEGACSLRDLCLKLGVARCCGRCRQHANQVLQKTLEIRPSEL